MVVPEGQWSEAGELVVLPPPEDEEVEAVLHRPPAGTARAGEVLLIDDVYVD